MKRLGACIRGDIYLQIKYGLYPIYGIITLLYVVFLKQLPSQSLKFVVPFIVFTDPSILGFFFIGGLILLEKGENTLEFLVATPIRIGEYLLAKMISLTLLAILAVMVITLLAYGPGFNLLLLALGVVMTSCFFILVGFIAVAKFRTINGYLMTSIIYMTFLCMPILDYFGLVKNPVFYLFPTHASILLIGGAFETLGTWKIVYGILYLLLWILISYRWAYRSFYRFIILREGEQAS